MAIKEWIRGDTQRVDVEFQEADGSPADLSGATAYLTMQKNKEPDNDTTALFQKTTTVHDDPTAGLTHFIVDSNDTQDAVPGLFYLDAEVVDTNGNVTSKKQKKIRIIGDSTRVNTA